MRVLVTNDDGIDAPGLAALALAMAELEHDVVAAAPMVDMSGSSAAIGVLGVGDHIGIKRTELDGLAGVEAFGIDGPPALAVMAARLGGFGEPPELVVSGINPGNNTGRATLHSGTVGAALTAANFGASALAVSTGPGVDGAEPGWETPAHFAAAAAEWLAEAPPKTVLNVNTPDIPLDEVRGVRWAELAPFGTVRTTLVDAGADRLQMELRASDRELPPDTDTALVLAGYVAVTVIVGVRAGDRVPVADEIERRRRRRRT